MKPPTITGVSYQYAQGTIWLALSFVWPWAKLNWKLLAGIPVALVLLLPALALFRRRRTNKRRELRFSEKISYLKNDIDDHVTPIDGGIVKVDPAVPRVEVVESESLVGTQTARSEQELELPLSAASVSLLPEVDNLALEPTSSSPAQFERTDLELQKLLSGREFDANLIDAADSATRQVVAASLIAALAGRNFDQHDHARQAFVNYGYFDETTKDLQTADSSAERASAARKLGVVGDARATAHLVASLYDTAPEVRRAAVESLGQIGDGKAIGPLNELLQRENSRQLPEAVIRHAINSISVSELKRTTPLEKPALRVVGSQSEPPVERQSNEELIEISEEIKQADQEPPNNLPATQPSVTAAASVVSKEEMELQAEQEVLRKAAAEMERQQLEAESARIRAQEETRLQIEAEALMRAETEASLRAEENARMRAEEEALRNKTEEEVRVKAEQEVTVKTEIDDRTRAEEERRFKLEAEVLRRAAEELARKRAEAESVRRLIEEEARRRTDPDARAKAEEEVRNQLELALSRRVGEQARRNAAEAAKSRAEESLRTQPEEAGQSLAAGARRLVEEEAHPLDHQHILRHSQAEGLLKEAEERRQSEDQLLHEEQQALLQAADDVVRRRREIEAARRKAEEQARVLAETQEQIRKQAEEQALLLGAAQERIQAEEEAVRAAEEQRQRFELEALARAEERRRVEEELLRAKQQIHAEEAAYQRLEEERQRALEEYSQREAAARMKTEAEALLLAEAQQRLHAEEEAHKQAEAKRHRFEVEAAERAEQRRLLEVETERLAKEDEQRLADLEAARKRAEDQVRQRAEVEQRIKAGIESLQRDEDEQRLRIEAEIKRRAEVEAKLREERARYHEEEAARIQAEREAYLAEETRHRTVEEARRRAEDDARSQAELEARRLADEEARRREEDEQRQLAEREARLRAEEEAQRQAEEEKLREEQELQRQAEYEAQQRVAIAYRRQQQETRLIEEEKATTFESGNNVSASEMAGDEVALPEEQAQVEPLAPQLPEHPSARLEDKGIDVVRAEKGMVQLSEDSDVPAELLERLNSDSPVERSGALTDLASLGSDDAFRLISKAFDDESPDVRNAAAGALYDLQSDRAASFTRALREGSPERRRNIGASLASSGLANKAIENLTGESREKTYDAFSLLFLMAKAGEVQPLMKAIEDDPNIEVRLAVVKLLALSGQVEIVPAFRRLAVRGSLPPEVRSAVMEAIYQISSQNRETAPQSAA